MTVIAWDSKILAADSLTSTGDVVAYKRSKIRIVKQAAIVTCGDVAQGDLFCQWWANGEKDNFTTTEYVGALILTSDYIKYYSPDGDDNVEDKIMTGSALEHKDSFGDHAAVHYATGLMRVAKYTAHEACLHAAQYARSCDLPVYSITKRQLALIDPKFDGFWVGTYHILDKQIDEYLISHKQWLKT